MHWEEKIHEALHGNYKIAMPPELYVSADLIKVASLFSMTSLPNEFSSLEIRFRPGKNNKICQRLTVIHKKCREVTYM
jgi:hypothetical protein